MADLYRDGTLSPAGDLLQVVRTAFDGLHVRISPFGDIAWRDAFTDVPYLNGVKLSDRATFGIYPLCFDPHDGSLFIQYADSLGTLDHCDRFGSHIGLQVVDAASEGIHHIDPNDGRIVMGNAPELLRRMPNGELWASVVETPTFVVGAYGEGAYPGALSYLHKPSGTYKRWLGYTPLPHRAVEHGGLYVFISGTPDSPDPSMLVWSDSFPVQPPVIVPPPVSSTNDIFLPLPLTPFPAAWVMMTCFDPPKVTPIRPGNAQHGVSPSDADPRIPVKEGAPYESTMVGRDWLLVAFSTEANAGGETGLAQSIDMAKRHGCGVEIHMDDHTHRDPMMAYRSTCLADGVVPVPSAHAVLNVDDFKADARELSRLGPFDITVNFHCIDKDPDTFRALMQAVEQIHRECLPRCITFIHWQVAGPQMQAYAAEYARLTPTPVTRPHQASQSLPPVTPPVTPPPVIVSQPRHGSGQQASKPSIFSGKQ